MLMYEWVATAVPIFNRIVKKLQENTGRERGTRTGTWLEPRPPWAQQHSICLEQLPSVPQLWHEKCIMDQKRPQNKVVALKVHNLYCRKHGTLYIQHFKDGWTYSYMWSKCLCNLMCFEVFVLICKWYKLKMNESEY